MRIELDLEELEELLGVCEAALGDLRVEVRRTSTHAYREKLSRRREHLAQAVDKLREAVTVQTN